MFVCMFVAPTLLQPCSYPAPTLGAPLDKIGLQSTNPLVFAGEGLLRGHSWAQKNLTVPIRHHAKLQNRGTHIHNGVYSTSIHIYTHILNISPSHYIHVPFD